MGRFSKISKRGLIISGTSIVILIAIILFLVYRNTNKTISYDASEVDHMEVEFMTGACVTEFCSTKFVVREQDNIADIIDSINHPDNRKIAFYKKLDGDGVGYSKVTVYMKDGTRNECMWITAGVEDGDPYYGMQDFLYREEIIVQISTLLHIESNDVARAEVYYYKQEEGERNTIETISDKKRVEMLLKLTQKDYLETSAKTLGDTYCGIDFYSKDGELISGQTFTRDSMYYDAFVKEIPETKKYLNN